MAKTVHSFRSKYLNETGYCVRIIHLLESKFGSIPDTSLVGERENEHTESHLRGHTIHQTDFRIGSRKDGVKKLILM